MLHSFVDVEREKLVEITDIYSCIKHVKGQKYKATLLKMIEDEIISKKTNLSKTIEALKAIDDKEKEFNINGKALEKRHTILILALQSSPNVQFKKLAQEHKNFFYVPAEVVAEWNEILPIFVKEDKFHTYVNTLINHFDLFYPAH
ncbi:MAG: hypothetical protein JWM09_809 [Francisellaceae bacterium]|nr:hypothetical protein [Francisellaceae bacterium]